MSVPYLESADPPLLAALSLEKAVSHWTAEPTKGFSTPFLSIFQPERDAHHFPICTDPPQMAV